MHVAYVVLCYIVVGQSVLGLSGLYTVWLALAGNSSKKQASLHGLAA